MKNKTQHTTLGQEKSLKNILYVWNPIHQNQKIANSKRIESFRENNILQNQNQGKAPPGRARGPGLGRGQPSAKQADRPENKGDPPATKTQYCIEYKYSNKYRKINFYTHQILFIMKKQILFLSFFILAFVFAGTKSYGQVTYTKVLGGAPAVATPTVLGCAVENELQPLPGKSYNYSVTAPAGSKILWFVTDQNTIIDGTAAAPVIQPSRDTAPGTYILTAGSQYNDANNTTATIAMSWKSFDGAAKQVVLVAHVTDASGCTNNVEVYRIVPSFAFTLDMIALLDAGTAGGTECISPVESATYNGTDVAINYGENWVFYSVNAANFVNSWMPTFTVLGYTGGGGTGVVPVGDIQWAYAANAQSTTAADWHPVTDPVMAQAAGGAVGAAGETIVIRVRIDHATNENDAANSVLTFGVDGVMFDPAALAAAAYTNATLKDLDGGATAPCTNTQTDQADYILTPRPAVATNTGSPVLPFEPKIP